MSKYFSSNELTTFQFHDARFMNISFVENNIVWELEAVNVTTSNSQNDLDVDMEAGQLYLSFEDCNIKKIDYYGGKIYYQDGDLTNEIPGRTYSKEEYPDIFKGLVDNGGVISKLLPSSDYNNHCSFDILTPFDGFTLFLNYTKATAEWNEFVAQAWYVGKYYFKQS